MATRLYGVSRGEDTLNSLVAEGAGSATAADDVEVTIDLTKSITREEFFRLLDKIRDHALKGNWPPA